MTKQHKGGQVTAIKLRKQALDRYYFNPNICKYCTKIIFIGPHEKVSVVRIKQFCNSTCAATYNNKLRAPSIKKYYCKGCGIELLKCKSKYNFKLCIDCRNINMLKKSILLNTSKQDLFNKRKNWQSARSTIVHNARAIFIRSGRELHCHICNYSKHVEIAHIKPVASFLGTSLIGEINSLTNLVPLCRNHHWEQENNLLDISLLKAAPVYAAL